MDQGSVPYVDALTEHAARSPGRFYVPGHKGGHGADPALSDALGGARARDGHPVAAARDRRRPAGADAVRGGSAPGGGGLGRNPQLVPAERRVAGQPRGVSRPAPCGPQGRRAAERALERDRRRRSRRARADLRCARAGPAARARALRHARGARRSARRHPRRGRRHLRLAHVLRRLRRRRGTRGRRPRARGPARGGRSLGRAPAFLAGAADRARSRPERTWLFRRPTRSLGASPSPRSSTSAAEA